MLDFKFMGGLFRCKCYRTDTYGRDTEVTLRADKIGAFVRESLKTPNTKVIVYHKRCVAFGKKLWRKVEELRS